MTDYIERKLEELQRRVGGSAAIDDGNTVVRQGELNHAATALARKIAVACAEQDPVVLLMNRSPESLVSMLACVIARRCFVPVTAGTEHGHGKEMITASKAKLVLSVHRPRASGDLAIASMEVSLSDLLSGDSQTAAACDAAAGNAIAYLLFTSGSTGRPKPVMVTRRGLGNYLEWAERYYRLEALDGVVAQLSPTFDASVTQSLLPLLSGRPIRIVPHGDELAAFPAILRKLVGAWLVKLTPSQLWALGQAAEEPFETLRGELVVGGEAMTAAHLALARRLFPRFRIHNEYGPTETVVGSSVYTVAPDETSDDDVPIGHPIDRTEIIVADEALSPCRAGAVGEILIAGAGVALGYQGLPAATAVSFVPHPGLDRRGQRVYRTGDFGYTDTLGRLRYSGRRDAQVKIRGQRVEIEGVWRRIAEQPSVDAVAIDVYEDVSGQRGITAYVRRKEGVDEKSVMEECRLALSAGMMPTRWHFVDSIPLTSHGKADIERLRKTTVSRSEKRGTDGTALEALADLWRRVLGHDEFSIDDPFFSVGGHSMLLLSLRGHIRRELGADLSPAELVRNETIRAQAELVRQKQAQQEPCAALSGNELGAARHEPAQASPFALSPTQQQIWLASTNAQRSGAPDAYSTSVLIRVCGPLDDERLRACVSEVVGRHGVFFLEFDTSSTTVVQRFGEAPRWSWGTEHAVSEEAVLERARSLASEALDPASGDLLRLRFFRVSERLGLALLQSHHIISDYWTTQLLVTEIVRRYGGRDLGPAPDREIYRSYCETRERAGATKGVDRQLRFWLRRLKDNPILPVMRRTGDGGGSSSQPVVLEVRVAADVDRRLEASMRQANETINTAYATVVACALGLSQALPVVRLASPLVHRDPEFQEAAGCFLNTICITAELRNDESLRSLTAEVGESVRSALENADVPYQTLLREAPLLANGDICHVRYVPVLDVTSNIALPDCDVTVLPLDQAASKFDLLVSIERSPDGALVRIAFRPEIYARSDVDKFRNALGSVAEFMALQPAMTLRDVRHHVREARAVESRKHREALERSLKEAGRRPVGVDARSGFRRSAYGVSRPDWLQGATLIEVRTGMVRLREWLGDNLAVVRDGLAETGAVLLRGFPVCEPPDFGAAMARMSDASLVDYEHRSTPRQKVGDRVFTSTEYPSEQHIPLHNENSYSHVWPAYIAFMCARPAARGGSTPIADSRRVLASLSEATRSAFQRSGVRYVRNYGQFGLSWQETFQSSDAEYVSAYCRLHGIEHTWTERGTLRTSQVLPAVRSHVRTGEPVWFNQAHLFHVSNLGEAASAAVAVFHEEELPRHATFGDGAPIPSPMLDDIRTAYANNAVVFTWQSGDVLLLDNMMWAHGRYPFEGDRLVLVGMTQPIENDAGSLSGSRVHASERIA